MNSSPQSAKPLITVSDFVNASANDLNIKILAGESALNNRRITSPRTQKLGLALAGFDNYIHAGRLQMVGQSEIWYLNQLSAVERSAAIRKLDLKNICCVLITKNNQPPAEMIEIAEEFDLPILQTAQVSSIAIGRISKLLTEMLAPQTSIHGVLLGMHGLGVLIIGESGVGKSECALDLITKGHSLVSDDLVLVKRIGDKLEGVSPDLTFGHLEIRGLGIINVKEIFGISAIGKYKKNIDLCIELKRWDEDEEADRLGLDTISEEIFGAKLTKFILPVSPGRNISTLVETAVRVYLLRISGYDAAQELVKKHTESLKPRE